MGKVITTINGDVIVYVEDSRGIFFEKLIREYIGDAAADYFAKFMVDLNTTVADYEEELRAWEQEVDGYISYCRDARDELSEIMRESKDSKIVNRAKNAYEALNGIL